MDNPPFGRAPLAAGPAWNEDGSIKEVWARWLVNIGSNLAGAASLEDIVGIAAILGGSRGATAESVMITALGLLTTLPPNPATAQQPQVQISAPALLPRLPDNPLVMLMQRPVSAASRNQIIICTQATFPVIAGVAAGTFIYVTDYAHLIFYDGVTPKFAGDNPGRIDGFLVNPGLGWALCNGAVTSYLNADGTLTVVTLPDYASVPGAAVFIKFGSAATGVPAIAVAPTVAITPFTPAGTNNAPAFTGVAMPLTSASLGGAGTTAITSVDGSTVTITPRGAVAAPVFTGALASPVATAGTNGVPANSAHLPYFRL